MIPLEHILVDKQTIGNHLLRNRHQLSVHFICHPHHFTQILHIVKTGQIHKFAFFRQLLNHIRIQQVQIIHIMTGPVKGHLIIRSVLIILRRVCDIVHCHPQLFLRHGNCFFRCASGHIVRIRLRLFHGAEQRYNAFVIPLKNYHIVLWQLPVYTGCHRQRNQPPKAKCPYFIPSLMHIHTSGRFMKGKISSH